ncbi:hypothetical protein AB205_0203960, partial [Aquarana catesbeiana]
MLLADPVSIDPVPAAQSTELVPATQPNVLLTAADAIQSSSMHMTTTDAIQSSSMQTTTADAIQSSSMQTTTADAIQSSSMLMTAADAIPSSSMLMTAADAIPSSMLVSPVDGVHASPMLPPADGVHASSIINFSADLKHLMQDVIDLDIRAQHVPSELLLHGSLTFPIGLSNNNQCFFGAAYYGKGRVVVGAHESYLDMPELRTFILNGVSWLDMNRNGKIGVNQLKDLLRALQNKGLSCVDSRLIPGLSVYCCTSYSDAEAEMIHRFVAEGGGLLIAGHAWYWSYSNPNVLSQYPGNKILNKFGISILAQTVGQGVYKALDPKALDSTYHFPRAICRLLRNLKSGVELKPPLSTWMSKLIQDVCTYMRLPASPLTLSLQHELTHLVKGCHLPTICKQCPVKNSSQEALILCLAQEVSCLECLDDSGEGGTGLLSQNPVTVQIDATNPGGDAWKSTGLFLPPGKTAILIFPASAAGQGLQEFYRAPVVIHRKDVRGEKVKMSCIWGGLLYIIVKAKSQLGLIHVTVYGAEQAPTFIKGKYMKKEYTEYRMFCILSVKVHLAVKYIQIIKL